MYRLYSWCIVLDKNKWSKVGELKIILLLWTDHYLLGVRFTEVPRVHGTGELRLVPPLRTDGSCRIAQGRFPCWYGQQSCQYPCCFLEWENDLAIGTIATRDSLRSKSLGSPLVYWGVAGDEKAGRMARVAVEKDLEQIWQGMDYSSFESLFNGGDGGKK